MPIPQVGDILIRHIATDIFELVDVVTGKHLSGPFTSHAAALDAARLRGARAIWLQNIDDRFRPLGDPFRLPSE
jgi:hypothetical protein